MDIVFITDSLIRGGAETQLTRIASTLQQRGWRVGIISMYPPNHFGDELDSLGIPWLQCSEHPGRSPHLVTWRMFRQLRRWRPTAVVTFNFPGDMAGRFAARLARVPIVVASQRTAHFKSSIRKTLYRRTECLVDLTVSNSQAAVDLMLAEKILSKGKAQVIPNGMFTDAYPAPITREQARQQFRVPEEAFLWVAVGSLTPAKDYSTLLRASAECAKDRQDFRLLVAGGGGQLEALQALVDGLCLADKVEFLGPLPPERVRELLRAGDALVLSSAWEGMPNTVMEGMASGLPVVATDVGGVRELLEPGISGLIAPPREAGALSSQMRSLMEAPPEERRAMGMAGRMQMELRHEHSRIADLWSESLQNQAARVKRPLPGPGPTLVVSLDMELYWGVRGKRSLKDYGDRILGERAAIPAMLDLFKKYDIHATWAAVGMLLFDSKKDLVKHLPDVLPTYHDPIFDPYSSLAHIGADEQEDPFHFGLSLVRQIMETPGMELGSHSFSHYYCLEDGQTPAQFRADLQASVQAIERLGGKAASFVFPRNQYRPDYLGACAEQGFKTFRGNECHWLYQGTNEASRFYPRRGMRVLDHYFNLSGSHAFQPWREHGLVNCPSSRFLRPWSPAGSRMEWLRVHRIRKAMEAAARSGSCFHLWWHPHNFGSDLPQNLATLESLLRHFADLRERFGMTSRTMSEVAECL